MKTFRYPMGHFAGETITVSELRDELAKFPPDMPVMAQWEGCHAYIDPSSFGVEKISKGFAEDECDCLVINVDTY